MSQEELFTHLANVSGPSFWAQVCRRVGTNKEAATLPLLMVSLREQNNDDPKTMKKILGDAYSLIINHKPS